MIGQEGTLGVITKARLRLTQRPLGRLSMIIFFRNLDATLGFVSAARQHATRPSGNLDDENRLLQTSDLNGLNPSAIEFFDHNALAMVRARVPGVPDAAHSALFVEIEHEGEPPIESWWEALMEHDALVDDIIVAEDDAGRAKLQAVRHAIPAGINEQVVQNRMPKISTDFSVPNSALPEMMEAYEKVPLTHITFGHIGDNHLHVNMLPTTSAELTQAKGIYRDLAHQAISLGGTVSAEHGIGKIKKELLADLVGKDVLAQFQDLKTKADPNWILGRGTLLAGPV